LALLAGRVSLREPPSTCFAQGENTALIPIDRHTHERFQRDGIDTIFIRARHGRCARLPTIINRSGA
jgi:hypothetical protein